MTDLEELENRFKNELKGLDRCKYKTYSLDLINSAGYLSLYVYAYLTVLKRDGTKLCCREYLLNQTFEKMTIKDMIKCFNYGEYDKAHNVIKYEDRDGNYYRYDTDVDPRC